MKNFIISNEGLTHLNKFINHINQHEDLKQNTLKEYFSDIKHFINWFESDSNSGTELLINFHPEKITTPVITKYRSIMQSSMNLKPATINRRLITLKRFFIWAKENGLINRNPASSVKLVKEERNSPQKMTDKQISDLVAAVENSGSFRDQTIIILLIHTGIRSMELCNLLKSDIIIGKRSGYLQVRTGKRNKHREVPLNSTSREYLDRYINSVSEGYLFPSEKTGSKLSERALRHLIQKYMVLAKLEGFSAHDLRHYFGYIMIENTPIHRLAQIMGHDSLNTTMIYVKATRADLQNEVEKIAWK